MLARGEFSRNGVGWPTHLPGLAGPALAAVLITALVDGPAGLSDLWARAVRWRIGWGWWVLVAATAALAVLGAVVPMLSGGTVPPMAAFASYSGAPSIGLLGVVLLVLVVNDYGEEAGWRGFAVDRLSRTHGLVTTALMVTGIWAVWHLPLFWVVGNFQDFGLVGSAGWLVGLTAGSIVLTWMYLHSGRSIALVAAWHTGYNLTSATGATAGVAAAASSTLVMLAAVAIVIGQRRETRRAWLPAPSHER